MKLYLFNPENDIALVHGRRGFTMSPIVSRLRADGAMLPMWYADKGDAVLGVCRDYVWLRSVCDAFGLCAQPVGSVDVPEYAGSPWGWSFDSARCLTDAGASVIGDDRIERIAMLSHRRISVEVMNRLREELPFAIPRVPVEVTDIDSLAAIVDDAPVYVKAPWSSSGRGVFEVKKLDERVKARVNGILRRQGSVLVEESLDKKRDFAMLFRARDSQVEWVGYSLFFNSAGDAYGGNILAGDDFIEDMLVSAGASRDKLHAIRGVLPAILAGLLGDVYNGYLGVDMLIAADGMIAPCVEVNLRMTMGVVAHILTSRYVSPGVTGVFRVMHGLPEATAGAVIDECRLKSGSVYLTPPSDSGFNFVMEVGCQDIVDRNL